VGIPEGKRSLGRRRRTWEDNIKMGLKDVGWTAVDHVRLIQGREKCKLLCTRL
jgi:hypothetical protein